jgi:hypothetical protein
MTSSNFRQIGSEVDCFKKLVYETSGKIMELRWRPWHGAGIKANFSSGSPNSGIKANFSSGSPN